MKTRQKIRRGLIIGSFALLPITLYYFSPVMSLGGTALGIVTGSLIVFAVQFISSLFVGRLF
jgi:ferredoxin-type protein NapH